MPPRDRHGDVAAHGQTHHHRPLDPARFEERRHGVRNAVDGKAVVVPDGSAETRQVEREGTIAGDGNGSELRRPHLPVKRERVQEDDRESPPHVVVRDFG